MIYTTEDIIGATLVALFAICFCVLYVLEKARDAYKERKRIKALPKDRMHVEYDAEAEIYSNTLVGGINSTEEEYLAAVRKCDIELANNSWLRGIVPPTGKVVYMAKEFTEQEKRIMKERLEK